MNILDGETISIMRAILQEVAKELDVTQATQAKMAEQIIRNATVGGSREEMKNIAIEAARIPAP
jgi:hypothetical protein